MQAILALQAPDSSSPVVKVKPRLRGVSHGIAFVVGLVGAVFLARAPATGAQYVAGLVYAVGMCLMFGLSALYHLPMWSHHARSVLRRFDHAGIFAQIGGTFTPVATLHAHGHWDFWLSLMWGGCALGMLFVVAFPHAPRVLRTLVYVVLGLVATPVVLSMPDAIGWARVGLVVAGAVVYLVGAVVYARRWPNPNPAVFGYHEVFHLLVILAAALQYGVVVTLQYV
jgi:hemolysin III